MSKSCIVCKTCNGFISNYFTVSSLSEAKMRVIKMAEEQFKRILTISELQNIDNNFELTINDDPSNITRFNIGKL